MNEKLIGDLFAAAMRRMTGSTSKEFSQKFAEEIVRECVDMFPDDLNSMSDYTGKACRYMIKEHFGLTKTVVAE